jgi:tetratricopeptide (TPR) repeat protein
MKGTNRKMDLKTTVNLLASHKDFFEPTGERAFGRSVARVSNIMTSIVMPSQARPGGKVWMTVADQLPPNHGYYAGFDVDFGTMSLKENGAVKSGTYATRPNYERSFERYHQAYIAFMSNQDSITALHLLEEASRLAEKDGVDEPTYKYLRARFLLKAGNAKAAYPLFSELASGKYEFHPLRKANIGMYLMRAGDEGGGPAMPSATRKSEYEFAKKVVSDIESGSARFHPVYPNIFGYVHAKHDLEAKTKMWKQIYAEDKDTKIQDVDMSTVD